MSKDIIGTALRNLNKKQFDALAKRAARGESIPEALADISESYRAKVSEAPPADRVSNAERRAAIQGNIDQLQGMLDQMAD